jgi:hypothetical protein
MLALVLAFASTLMVVGKASAHTTGDAAALSPAAQKAIANLARNSQKLGGKPPSAYFDRVNFKSVSGTGAVPAVATQLVGPTNITVPGAIKFVRVTGNATFFGGAANYVLWFAVDDVCTLSGVGFDNRSFGNTTQQENSTIDFVLPVSPGVHTFRLCGLGAAGVNAISKTLTLETIAKGPNGGNVLAKLAGRPAPDRDGNPVTPG